MLFVALSMWNCRYNRLNGLNTRMKHMSKIQSEQERKKVPYPDADVGLTFIDCSYISDYSA